MESKKWILSPRQRCDLEMLLVEGFKPLSGFLSEADYKSVVSDCRLANGQLWPMPVTLDVGEAFAATVSPDDEIALCDEDNSVLAFLTVTDKWKPDKGHEAQSVFGTVDRKHPGVAALLSDAGEWYLGGSVRQVKLPVHYDFRAWRRTPASLRQYFRERGYERVVGFQTRNPMHRAHMELTLRAAKELDAHVLIHPVVGMTRPNDVDYYTRVRCYQKILPYYPAGGATLSLLPLAMRMGGPREALWHAIIRKNVGCTHFIVGRDHAGPGTNSEGQLFYDPYAAQALALAHEAELGIQIVPFQEMVYVKERKKYSPVDELQPDETALSISGTQLRDALLAGQTLPAWFTFPEIMEELRQSCPPRHAQGVTLFFTGLSGAGKTTLAQALMASLMSEGKRNITLLDGDVTRRMLASDLGFSKADRDLNIRRIGYVAAEITRVGGMAICAAIAPYADIREENRRRVSRHGNYIEIYLSTSLSACEERDTKGLYAKARSGTLKGMTGVDDPYEPPTAAEISIDTANCSIEGAVEKILNYLYREGFLKREVIASETATPQSVTSPAEVVESA